MPTDDLTLLRAQAEEALRRAEAAENTHDPAHGYDGPLYQQAAADVPALARAVLDLMARLEAAEARAEETERLERMNRLVAASALKNCQTAKRDKRDAEARETHLIETSLQMCDYITRFGKWLEQRFPEWDFTTPDGILDDHKDTAQTFCSALSASWKAANQQEVVNLWRVRDQLRAELEAAEAREAGLRAALETYLTARPQCECSDQSGCPMAEARVGARAALAAGTETSKP